MMIAPYTASTSKGKKPYKSWLKDGVNGGPSSMDVLVNWLSKKANYAKWKGDDCERIPKKSLLESIIDEMREVGIYHRLAKDVASKISTLQSNYRLAREWKEVDGKKLLETGATEDGIHEELLKRFPYWDALNEVFNSNRTSSWPMSISSIMHNNEHEEEENPPFFIKQEEYGFDDEHNKNDDILSPPQVKRQRRLSDSHFRPDSRSSMDNSSDSASTAHSTQSMPVSMPHNTNSFLNSNYSHHGNHPLLSTSLSMNPPIIRPLPRALPPTPIDHRDTILAESLIQVTREKEAGRMKRSQDMLQFLREKRMERDQLLIEKEMTRRVKAKADLVKNLMEAGFDKEAITEQLNKL